MAKIKKTFSFDAQVLAKLEAMAQAQGITSSACLAVIINQVFNSQQLQQSAKS